MAPPQHYCRCCLLNHPAAVEASDPRLYADLCLLDLERALEDRLTTKNIADADGDYESKYRPPIGDTEELVDNYLKLLQSFTNEKPKNVHNSSHSDYDPDLCIRKLTTSITICSVCLDKLHTAYEFQGLCQRSNGLICNPAYLLDASADDDNAEDDMDATSIHWLVDEIEGDGGDDENAQDATFGSIEELLDCDGDNTNASVEGDDTSTAVADAPKDWLVKQEQSIEIECSTGGCRCTSDDHLFLHLSGCPSAPTDAAVIPSASSEQMTPHQSDSPSTPTEEILHPSAGSEKNAFDRARFECDYCGQGRATRMDMLRHMRTEHVPELLGDDGANSRLCATCGRAFATAQRLRAHTTHTHSGAGDDRPHRCDLCAAGFASAVRLRAHQRTHTGERPFACSVCAAPFAQRHALKCHMRTHTGERPYRCAVCGRCFAQQTILTTHMTLHTGKPVPCPDCDRRFSRRSFLVAHRRAHHAGDRPYACDRCPQRYTQQSHLSRHILGGHLGVRYACTECDKVYTKQWSLKQHMYEHGGRRPFVCTVAACVEGFVRRDKWRGHMARKHGVVAEEGARGGAIEQAGDVRSSCSATREISIRLLPS